jgi:hypothetical protein
MRLTQNFTLRELAGSHTAERWASTTRVPFFGAFGAAWDDGMVARWSANPLGMLWPEMDAAFVTSGGGNSEPPAAARRTVVVIAGS